MSEEITPEQPNSSQPQQPQPQSGRAQRVDTTSGSLVWKMLVLSWPIVLTYLLQSVVSVADIYMVGKLGAKEVAAVGIARSVTFILVSLSFAVAMGVRVLVAQYSGSDQMEMADRAVKQGIIAATLLSLAFISPVGIMTSRWIMVLLGATPEVVGYGLLYLQLLFGGVVFLILSFVMTGALQGAGDTITPLILLLVTNAVNIAVNYVFIFGWGPFPQLGVTGAAIGTLTSRFLVTVAGLWIFSCGKYAISVNWVGRWHIRWDFWKKIFYLGTPASVQSITRNLGFMAIIRVLSMTSAGMLAISAFTIAGQIRMVTGMVGLALMAGATTAVGQNVGADNYGRAAKSAWMSAGMAAALSTVAATIYAITGPTLVELFNANPKVIKIGAEALLILAFSEPFLTAGMSLSGSLRGAGDTMSPLWVSIVSITVLGPLASYVLAIPMGMDTVGVWLGFDIGIVVRMGLLAWVFLRGKWKEVEMLE